MVMMDEPSAGLAPGNSRGIFENIRRLNRDINLTVLMLEQNARQGLETSHRGYVLELGAIPIRVGHGICWTTRGFAAHS